MMIPAGVQLQIHVRVADLPFFSTQGHLLSFVARY